MASGWYCWWWMGQMCWETVRCSGFPGTRPFARRTFRRLTIWWCRSAAATRGSPTKLIHALEERARGAKCPKIGVGVGLFKEYGAAQRLYVHLGYVPDGKGMASGGLPVAAGDKVLVDDDLVLWLVKELDTPAKQ